MENSASQVHHSFNAEKVATLVKELPNENFMGYDMYLWEGSWFPEIFIEYYLDLQSNFKARDDDIILASPPKCGTTWLKALASTIVHGCKNEDEDSLVTKNPHVIVPTIDSNIFFRKTIDQSSIHLNHSLTRRVLHSHFPYHCLPDSIKNSSCKLIYVARDPKDTFVSLYHFLDASRTPEQGPYPLNQMFETFCEGVHPFGPYLDHVLGYWNASLKDPKRVLFLKYEDLQRDPKENVKKLAEFLGKPFSNDEEADNMIWRCSFDRLKNLEVNTTGSLTTPTTIKHTSFFRRGVVGDWKNYLTEEMGEKLDQISRSKLAGSGLEFDV